MNDKDFIGQRAMNDYTANKVKPPKKWIEPKKIAMMIGSNSPMEPINLKTKIHPTNN